MTGAGEAGSAGNAFARDLGCERLRSIAVALGLDAVRVMALDDAEPGELLALSDAELGAYARALIATDERKAGRVPEGWTEPATCAGCGPVLLWPGVPREVQACPWCWNRASGLAVPCPGCG